MSGWGPWKDETTGLVHVVPCDTERRVLNGHEKSTECWCRPQRLDDEPRVVRHNDRERGGCNA